GSSWKSARLQFRGAATGRWMLCVGASPAGRSVRRSSRRPAGSCRGSARMGQRNLLIVGFAAVAASVLVAAAGTAIGLSTSSVAWPGGMMGAPSDRGSGDIGIDRAVGAAQGVAASYPGGGLAVDEVIEF